MSPMPPPEISEVQSDTLREQIVPEFLAFARRRADGRAPGRTGEPGVDGAAAPQPIAADELAARVRAAAQHAIDAEIALGAAAGLAWPIVSRALTGDPAGLPRPLVLVPWEDDSDELTVDAAEDEDGFHRVMNMLLDELEQHARATHPPDSVV